MPKNLLLLLPLLTLGTLSLMGARHGPFAQAPLPAESLFVPQTVPLNHALIGDEATGEQLLNRALENLAPGRMAWLHTRVWQKMIDREAHFEAEGTLTLGPHHCARLELTMRPGGKLLVVSDGHALAEVVRVAGEPPAVIGDPLPTDDRDTMLRDKGCGGPRTLLADLRQKLRQPKLQTGRLRDAAVIQVKGELDATVPEELRTEVPVQFGYVYLDAQTLWPHRVEWRGRDRAGQLRTIVQVEYRDPVLNRELSLAECARVFTYHPGAGEVAPHTAGRAPSAPAAGPSPR